MTKYRIWYSDSFQKRSKRFKQKHPEMVKQYEKSLRILEVNPYHPSLRLHKLKGKLKNFYSVSINLQYRLLIHFIIKDDLIIPVDVGTQL